MTMADVSLFAKKIAQAEVEQRCHELPIGGNSPLSQSLWQPCELVAMQLPFLLAHLSVLPL